MLDGTVGLLALRWLCSGDAKGHELGVSKATCWFHSSMFQGKVYANKFNLAVSSGSLHSTHLSLFNMAYL